MGDELNSELLSAVIRGQGLEPAASRSQVKPANHLAKLPFGRANFLNFGQLLAILNYFKLRKVETTDCQINISSVTEGTKTRKEIRTSVISLLRTLSIRTEPALNLIAGHF